MRFLARVKDRTWFMIYLRFRLICNLKLAFFFFKEIFNKKFVGLVDLFCIIMCMYDSHNIDHSHLCKSTKPITLRICGWWVLDVTRF